MNVRRSHVDINTAQRPVTVRGHWIWSLQRRHRAERTHCLFRRTFSVEEIGSEHVLRISADSRYKAYLNGELISRGPCRGLLDYYHFETVSLADRLRVDGPNVLAVDVCWYGEHSPVSEVHLRPGLWFMIGSEGDILSDAATRTLLLDAYAPYPKPANLPGAYTVVDACEDADLRGIPVGWEQIDFEDGDWDPARLGTPAIGRYQYQAAAISARELIIRSIPPMEETPQAPKGVCQQGTIELSSDPAVVRCIEGTLYPDVSLPSDLSIDFPDAGTHYLVVDMGELATGYPRVAIEAPAGSIVELRYAEALTHGGTKGVRSDPTGEVYGYYDTFVCRDGLSVCEPFTWRTYRYLRIAVHHPEGAVRGTFSSMFTAYPFAQRAWFESSDPLHSRLWDVSWRTARLCAHEHYEDCPYYEQLQYAGDTRLQSLVSYLVAGDFRLANQALHQFASSRRSDGIILSRSPSVMQQPQIIPTFSLIWVGYLEDYYLYSGELEVVRHLWGYVESILSWFEMFVDDGVARNVPYWVFSDWSYPRPRGSGEHGPVLDGWPHLCGSSGELNLRWYGALLSAMRLAEALGFEARVSHFRQRAQTLGEAIRDIYWSEAEGLFRDEPEWKACCEHPSLLAILHDLVDGDEAQMLFDRLLARDDLARTTIYYSYYTFRVYAKLGRYGDAWRDRLSIWTDMLALDATTWLEMPEPSRSDCHAWGSWIMCDLLTEVLGIQPTAPGFAQVRIHPHPMNLQYARGAIPTWRGMIEVDWRRLTDAFQMDITLPEGVGGTYVAPDGSEHTLGAGFQTFRSPC